MKVRNLGKKSFDEVCEKMRELGYVMDFPEERIKCSTGTFIRYDRDLWNK